MKSYIASFPALFLVSGLAFAQSFQVESVPNPSNPGSIQANWTVTQDGKPLLSWVETEKDGSYTLKYSIRSGAQWSQPRTIAAHREFFRHPAELPGMVQLADGTFLAHWVEMPEGADDAEFLHVTASKDGATWSKPIMAHKDKSMVQHGLASMTPSGDHEASVMWLEALKGEDGPVSLKRTVINNQAAVVKEETLDTDVCACCPTAIVNTAKGLLVAYRDHTKEDIRDISVIRFEGGKWSDSKNVNPDKWKLNACPTNAAAAAAKGNQVAISWYTGAQENPRVEAVFSSDGGATFGRPVLVSTGHAFGYTSLALDDHGGAIVSWLEQGGSDTRILARSIAANGALGAVTRVAEGPRKTLGYPKMLRAGGETWVAWAGSSGPAKVQTARLK
jgi:hypothetical protein